MNQDLLWLLVFDQMAMAKHGYTYRFLSVKNIKIEPHDDLLRDELNDKEVSRIVGNSPIDQFNMEYSPVLYEVKSDSFQIIRRHWSFERLIDLLKIQDDKDRNKDIGFFVIEDKTQIVAELEYDKLETRMLKHGVKAIKNISDVTQIRKGKEAREKVCPICGYALVYDLYDQKPDADNLYIIKCFNQGNKRCFFQMRVTEYQYRGILTGTLKTSDLLVLIEGKPCPHCGGSLYWRTLKDSETGQPRIFETCICFLLKEPFCLYNREIKIDNNQSELLF